MGTTFTYTVPTILNLNPRRDPDITINSQLNPGGNTADFWIGNDGEPQFSQIEVDDPVTGFRMFRGTVSQYTDEMEDVDAQVTQIKHEITGIGPSWIFNKKRPFGSFTNVSLTTVISSLVTTYAPDFTLVHLQTGLPTITIIFTGEELLMDAITRAVQLAGNCRWYLDYNYDVHCYYVGSPAIPTTIVRPGPPLADRPTVTTSNVQIEVSQYVTTPVGSTPGATLFAYAWEYDDGQVSGYSPWATVAWDGASQINLSGIATGAAVGGHNVVARRVYSALVSNPSGGGDGDVRNFQPSAFLRIPDNTTTSVSLPYFFLNVGTPPVWSRAYGSGQAFSPALGLPVNQPAITPAAPGGAPTITTGSTIPGSLTYTPGHYVFAFSFLYEDGSESAIGPVSSGYVADGSHSPIVSSVSTGPAIGSLQCIARKIYYAFSFGGTPTFDPTFGQFGFFFLADNTSTSCEWDATYGNFPPNFGSYTLSFRGTPLTQPALGPNPELDGLNPDNIVDGDPNLMKDPPFKVTYDISQVRNRVFVRGAGSNITADCNIGVTVIPLPLNHPFSGTGGSVFIKDRVYQYLSATTTSITLTSGLVEALKVANGDFCALWVQADDTDAQSWLATQEDGDGVHEYTIVDTSLTTIYDMQRRAGAELAMYSRPIVTVAYCTRDVKSVAGRTVSINLTNPPINGSFIIQTVKNDQIDYTQDNSLLPRFQVTAANVFWTLDDFLRNVALISAGGGQGSSGTGAATGGSGSSSPTGTTVGGTAVNGEVPGGAVPGTAYTTANVYFAGTLRVFVNGLRQKLGVDYTEASAGFTMLATTVAGDVLVVDYVH